LLTCRSHGNTFVEFYLATSSCFSRYRDTEENSFTIIKELYIIGIQYLTKIESLSQPSARGYNWATLFLGDINTGTWPFRLGESQIRG
jgi:hypothetical protein